MTCSFLCDRNKYFTLTPRRNLEKGGALLTLKWTPFPSCSVGAFWHMRPDLCALQPIKNTTVTERKVLDFPFLLHKVVFKYVLLNISSFFFAKSTFTTLQGD